MNSVEKPFVYSYIFWIAVLIHACFWTFAPPYTIPNYRLDTLEMMVIGHNWVLTTFKHPAFQGWVVEILSMLFHRAEFVPFLAAQLAMVLSLWGIWKLAQKFLSPPLALVAALAMLSYLYFNFESTIYNNRTFMRSFWILAVYFFYCATESGKNRYWLLTGVMLGLGLTCKLTTFLLVFTILVYMFVDPYARKYWKTIGPYLSTGICFLIFLPILIVFSQQHFAVLNHAQGSIYDETPTVFEHIYAPIRFSLTQLFAIGPILIPLLPFLGFRWRLDRSPQVSRSNPQYRFLTMFIFFPFGLQFIIAACGGEMRTALGCHLWVFLPIYLLYIMQCDGENLKSFRRSITLVFTNILLFAVLGTFIFAIAPYVSGKGSREHFPGKDLAAAVETIWEDRFHTPLPYLRGDDWPVENVAVYASSRPKVFSELWSTEDDFAKKGGILLWMESVSSSNPEGPIFRCYGNFDFNYSPDTGRPDEWLAQFPEAEVLPSIVLPKKTRFQVPPAKIGIAILPPR